MTNATTTTDVNSATTAGQLSCDPRQPSVSSTELLAVIQNGSASFKAAMYLPFPLLVILIVLFIDLVIFHVRNSIDSKRTRYTLLVVSVFAVLPITCVIGLYVPASAALISFAKRFYFSIALVHFLKLVINMYGGDEEVENALKDDGIVTANPFPCCFVCCCHNQPMSVTRLKKLKWTCNQVLFALPTLYFFQSLLEADGLLRRSSVAVIMSVILQFGIVASSLTSLYVFTVIGKSATYALQEFSIQGKYISMSWVVAFDTLQEFIINITDTAGALTCGFPYPDRQYPFLWHVYILFYELFLVGIMGWYFYRKSYNGCHVRFRNEPTSASKSNISSDITDTKISFSEDYANINTIGSFKSSASQEKKTQHLPNETYRKKSDEEV